MIFENLGRVAERIHQAARSAGRDAGEVRLVTVTKGHPVESVRQAILAGADCLGENYVEEGIDKIKACADLKRVEWHMIGHIQSRKAGPVCEHFDWVHSLDRIKLASRLDRFAQEHGRVIPVLLECNVSGEETKYGWPAWQEDQKPQLYETVDQILEMKNLQVRGLMTMAPFFSDAEQARPYFIRLRQLRNDLARRFPQTEWHDLSMGMSGDFEVAVQEGATIVRIGTAIMGPRPGYQR